MYNVTLNGLSTITPLTIVPAGQVGASDGVGGIRFQQIPGSNWAFSNLTITGTLSTNSTFTNYLSAGQLLTSSIVGGYGRFTTLEASSTFTNYISAGQLAISTVTAPNGIFATLETSSTFTNYLSAGQLAISSVTAPNGVFTTLETSSTFTNYISAGQLAISSVTAPNAVFTTLRASSTFTNYLSASQIVTSSIIAQSALVVGSNTLIVAGQSYLSSLTMTGQFIISTIPGVTPAPLAAKVVSSLQLQTSSIVFSDNVQIGAGGLRVAIGSNAAVSSTGHDVAIGVAAGEINAQGISIGYIAGQVDQGQNAVAIGALAGRQIQGNFSVALGQGAGYYNQGDYSIGIGYAAGYNLQAPSTIILNATGNALNSIIPQSFCVAPIRNNSNALNPLLNYNTSSKEITYGQRIYTSSLVTDGGGSAQWDFPTPFASFSTYTVTLTCEFNGDIPSVGCVAARDPSYVHISSVLFTGAAAPNTTVNAFAIGV